VSAAVADPSFPPPFVARGVELQELLDAYRERLGKLEERLTERLEANAPELTERLAAAIPPATPPGYGVLPALTPDPVPPTAPWRAASASYSWPRTRGFLDTDLARLSALENRIQAAGEPQSDLWRTLVDDYSALAKSARLIAHHVEHNRFWQARVDRNIAGYRDATRLHDAVLERQAILLELESMEVAPADLIARERALYEEIQTRPSGAAPPPFVRVEQPLSGSWVLRVPVVTDIEDGAFVERFRSAVEDAWSLNDTDARFRLALDIRYVTPEDLYGTGPACNPPRPPAASQESAGEAASSSGSGCMPGRGAALDLTSHVARFPPDTAVLTTGARITHVAGGRCVAVGPQDIAPRVFAHEFGHVLGFADGYFRGFRDLGREGYEILEVVADPEDIMSSPGNGRVLRRHFDELVAHLTTR